MEMRLTLAIAGAGDSPLLCFQPLTLRAKLRSIQKCVSRLKRYQCRKKLKLWLAAPEAEAALLTDGAEPGARFPY
jgi:hypothetical protein